MVPQFNNGKPRSYNNAFRALKIPPKFKRQPDFLTFLALKFFRFFNTIILNSLTLICGNTIFCLF